MVEVLDGKVERKESFEPCFLILCESHALLSWNARNAEATRQG